MPLLLQESRAIISTSKKNLKYFRERNVTTSICISLIVLVLLYATALPVPITLLLLNSPK
jgi:hypothetical protein